MRGYVESARYNLEALSENPYPGRGIVLGLNGRGDEAQQAYWVMGRSENSRNRILAIEDDVVRTEPHDPAKVEDPSLIIYNAMRSHGDVHIVSNGSQTDTFIGYLEEGRAFEEALEELTYEPDAPNYTPRISGFVELLKERQTRAGLSIIRKVAVSGLPVRNYFEFDAGFLGSTAGVGACVHTYRGDGDPLPSFKEPPYGLPMGETIDETAHTLWENLNPDNRVAIVVKGIHLATGDTLYKIINAHEQGE